MNIGIKNVCIKIVLNKLLEATFAEVLLNYFSEASVTYCSTLFIHDNYPPILTVVGIMFP
jgi:hypothetical protein